MFCFCRGYYSRIFFPILLLAALGTGGLCAATVNYADDRTLAETRINTVELQGGTWPLVELLTRVEKQTWLRFVYGSNRPPTGAEVRISEGAEEISLANLLAEISGQAPVIFSRQSGLIAVSVRGADDVVVAAVAEAASPTTAPEPSGETAQALATPSIQAGAAAMPSIDETLQLEKFKVSGKAAPNSQAVLRERASVAVDLITSRDFNRYIATDVSDIVIRLPGFSTTTRGSFAVVRGLAERYNPIMLDGIVLPSSDPERQTPELDLFPTRLVDTVVVSKVFAPHLPATASGGAVDLRTKPLPQGRFAQIQFGLRADEGALEGDEFFRSDAIGIWDHFALGAKDRPLAPQNQDAQIRRTQDRGTRWAAQGGNFPLGTKFAVAMENKFDLGGDGRAFGYAFSFGYDSAASSETGRVFSVGIPDPVNTPGIALANGNLTGRVSGEDFAEYEQEVKVGALLTLGLAFNRNHTLSFSAFTSQVGTENATSTFNGFNDLTAGTRAQLEMLYKAFDTGTVDPAFRGVGGNEAALLRSESVYYRQRNLTDLKLSGEHKFEAGRGARLDWAVANIQASQEEPDFSYLGYSEYFPVQAANPKYFIEYGQPVRRPARFWREVSEQTVAARIDGEIGFDMGWMKAVAAKMGVASDTTERSYLQESYVLTGGLRSTGNTLAELITDLQDANFGIGGRSFGVNPAFTDSERKLRAGYLSLMFPLLAKKPWAEKLDLLLGARFENYKFFISGRGTQGNASSTDYYLLQTVTQKNGQPVIEPGTSTSPARIFTRTVDENTLHPSLALTWSPRERLNVRLAYSRTVARPSFRELSPYFTNDEVTNEIQHGNILLNTSKVENLDFRLEYFFPKSRDLVALSLFSKKIANPIEKSSDEVLGSDFAALGWFNNPNDAKVRGAEVEAAKNLEFLGETGSYFTVGGNATLIDAKVQSGPGESRLPGTERNLFDQPEWIGNAYLTFEQPTWGFSSTVSWFTISDVLRSTATGKWDTYVAAHDRMDLTLSQRFGPQWLVRISAKNITDPERKHIADPEVVTEEVVYRRFKDGRSYSLTATYDF